MRFLIERIKDERLLARDFSWTRDITKVITFSNPHRALKWANTFAIKDYIIIRYEFPSQCIKCKKIDNE